MKKANISNDTYLGIDLGASSGRIIVGTLNDGTLTLKEIYRFPNEGIRVFNSMYWDILYIYRQVLEGLKIYVNEHCQKVSGIGVDTWGVDHVLLDSNDELIGPVNHYRDNRTAGMLEEMFKIIPKEEIFNQTGIQFMSINTSVHLFSIIYSNSPRLKIIKTILMVPDYFNFLLSGIKKSEYTIASTSQLFNVKQRTWAFNLIEKLGLKKEWFCEIISPGTILGTIRKEISKDVGLDPSIKIVATASHDTGSAVAAVPVDMQEYKRGEWAYISSGTWSLLGVELNAPIINKNALKYNFTNEGGVNGTIRFLKNITGLWIIQEVKRNWEMKHGKITWNDIMKEAESAAPFKFFLNPDDSSFLNPPNMIQAIQDYCKKTSQEIPETIGEIARMIFESLAFRYKQVLEFLENIIKNKIKVFHVIGGGSKNALLCQFTSNAINLPVLAGPSEATAIGNILVQGLATGAVKSLHHLRAIIRTSFSLQQYFPENTEDWEKAYEKYLKINFKEK
ncbi:MAG: rhamnulokinase [Promethearchaeota archaeon]